MAPSGSMGSGMNACWRRSALLLAGGVALSWGQFKPADPARQPSDAPTFSVKVNLVRLLVSVRDATGAIADCRRGQCADAHALAHGDHRHAPAAT